MKLWNKLYLKQKILFVFLPISIISILLILIVSVSFIVKNNHREMIQNSSDKLRLVADQTDRIISNVKYNIKAFSTSSALQDAIRANYPTDTYGNYLFFTSMHSSVYNIMDIASFIKDGYIQTYDDKIFNMKSDSVSLFPTDQMKEDYEKIAAAGGQISVTISTDNSGESAFHFSKSLIDINNGNCLGILSFDMKEELFYDAYSTLSAKSNEQFLLVSSDGTVISAGDRSLLRSKVSPSVYDCITKQNSPYEILSVEGEKQLILSLPISESDAYAVYIIPYYNIIQNAVEFVKILIIIAVFILLVTVVLSGFLANSLVKPLSQLTACVDAVGDGALDIPLTVTSHDEIGILFIRFKEMLESIKNLTLGIYHEQNQRREYELRLLQSQINPHFLYNCLDNITTLIDEKENDIASHMVRHLGRYYRGILSRGRNIITIKEELQLVRDYLEIQLIKAPDSFTYSIACPENLEAYKILKLLLQPIVENSVMHGFAGFLAKGHITIDVISEADDVFITIADNGRGMDEQILSQVFTTTQTAVPMHFGLKNIQDRITLKFGSEYGITIQSIPNSKTTVTVRFPRVL